MFKICLFFLTALLVFSCSENEKERKKVFDKAKTKQVQKPVKLEYKKEKPEKRTFKTSNQAVRAINQLPEIINIKKNAELSVFTEDETAKSYTIVVDEENDMTSVELMRFEVNKSGEIFAYDLQNGELLPLKKWQKRYNSEYGRK
jgi:hypothetical protein